MTKLLVSLFRIKYLEFNGAYVKNKFIKKENKFICLFFYLPTPFFPFKTFWSPLILAHGPAVYWALCWGWRWNGIKLDLILGLTGSVVPYVRQVSKQSQHAVFNFGNSFWSLNIPFTFYTELLFSLSVVRSGKDLLNYKN